MSRWRRQLNRRHSLGRLRLSLFAYVWLFGDRVTTHAPREARRQYLRKLGTHVTLVATADYPVTVR
jgi:hypothetical protein